MHNLIDILLSFDPTFRLKFDFLKLAQTSIMANQYLRFKILKKLLTVEISDREDLCLKTPNTVGFSQNCKNEQANSKILVHTFDV